MLSFILLVSFFRLYNLSWGEPYYFHPDERNIANAVSQLSYPESLNPRFFAYGALPIYITYAVGLLYNLIPVLQGEPYSFVVSFEQAILILRSLSALFSILLIPLIFVIGRLLKNTATGLLAAFFTTTSIGLIQYAHFGTFEIWLTLLSTLLFLSHLLLWRTGKSRYIILQAVFFGLLVATKISSLSLFPLLFILPTLFKKQPIHHRMSGLFKHGVAIGSITLFIFLLFNPFSLLDLTSFTNSLSYESAVATGNLPVFYTGEFVTTTPVLYHLLNIYPFLLNPLVFALLLPSFFFVFYQGGKKRNTSLLLLMAYIFILFLSQALLFVKWTRYLIPTLPFLYLVVALFLTSVLPQLTKKIYTPFLVLGKGLGALTCILFALAFFITTYTQSDTRIKAATWAGNNIPTDAQILSEVYDLGVIPFNERLPHITLFNFYDLDNNSVDYNQQTLDHALRTHDYLILPSQRIVKSRLLHPQEFPVSSPFYADLLSEHTTFTKIYQTPCDFWCTLTYWGNPVFAFEGTTNIFDRPTIFIFQKIR